MRKLMALMIVAWVGIMLGGCSTLSETSKERQARLKRQQAKEWKMAVEDWDRFWLQDHTTRLSPNNI